MTNKERWRWDIKRNGMPVTLTQKTGTACPCLAERGAYSPGWHAAHLTAEDCQGREIIDTTTTETTLLAYMVTAQGQTWYAARSKELATVIGEMQKDDLLMVGVVTNTGVWFDMNPLVETSDTINFKSKYYVCRHVVEYFETSSGQVLAQVCILKRVE